MNVWEYDDQTFVFGDGRLALRGRNGSGKSNALALLFPFILDGVMSAARMDPMGGGRSMKSLLLGRDDDDRAGRYRHESGTGYVWMEFGNGGSSVTIGVGAAATQHRDAEPWFFLTSQRVGHDLELTENDVPLGRRQLEARITDGTVFQRADDYRAAVDRRLLGLGDSRYRRLVDLLLTLRRPHLAGKLDTENLSATLSAGLSELDSALIHDVAHSFDDLDSMQKELVGLAASLNAVERFLPVYREHLIHAGHQRGRAVLDAASAISDNDRGLNRARRELRTEDETRKILAKDKSHAEAERNRLVSHIENILVSPAYQDATTLDEVHRAAGVARKMADTASANAQTSTREAGAAAKRSQEAATEVAARSLELTTAVAGWLEAARIAGIELSSQTDFDDTWAVSLVAQRRDEVDQVKRLIRKTSEASKKAQQAEEFATGTLAKLSDAERTVDAARNEVSVQQGDLVTLRAAWSADLNGLAKRFSGLTDHPEPEVELVWETVTSIIANDLEEATNAVIQTFQTADRQVGKFDLAVSSAFDAALAAEKTQQLRVGELE
ncbi:MAG: hypothetical protein LH616_12645, partial [Ilumatobacteraceae bacterium]|nr:hypothetical protein [Ilumatobacteraceae bacterium]